MNPSRLRLIWLVSLVCLLPLRAAQPDLRELLRDALYTEEVTRDPDKAAQQYEELVARHDAQKTFAASALFRLAEVRRKQDRKDEAIQLYQRLIAEFPNAETETKLARENLAALGAKNEAPPSPAVDEDAIELKRLEQWVESSPDRLKDPNLVLDAIRNGQLRSIEFLLNAGASAEEPWKLLREAVISGNLRTTTLLLDYPFKSGYRGVDNALFTAVTLEYHDIAKLLLSRGADPHRQDWYRIDENVTPPSSQRAKMTALHVAVRKRNSELCKLLLDHKADPNRFVEEPALPTSGSSLPDLPCGTPLHDAVVSSLEITRLLIEHGANVNAVSENTGVTPLFVALKLSEPDEVIQFLIEKGANLEVTTKGPAEITKNDPAQPGRPQGTRYGNVGPVSIGSTPLQVALEWRKLPAARQLLKSGASAKHPGILSAAVNTLDPDLVKQVLAKGALETDLNADPIRALACRNLDSSLSPARQQILDLLHQQGVKPKPAWVERYFEEAALDCMSWLYQNFLVPRLQEKPAITAITPSMVSREPLALSTGNSTPPDTFEQLLMNPAVRWPMINVGNNNFFPIRFTLWRKNADAIHGRLDGVDPLPELQWGDVIELAPDWEGIGGKPASYSIGYYDGLPPEVLWHIRKRISFPVTVEIDGKSRALSLRGDRLIFDPGYDQVPLVGASRLASLLWRPEFSQKDLSSPKLSVVRKGWPEVSVPWDPLSRNDFVLKPGDHLVIQSPPPPDDLLDRRKRHVALRCGNASFVRIYGDEHASSFPTLLQALAEAGFCGDKTLRFAPADPAALPALLLKSGDLPLQLLPHPDFSKIVIRRLDSDGNEKKIPIDLAAIIASAAADTTPEQARKADVALEAGDIVEVPQLPGMAGTSWKGFSEAESRFFAKALDCKVQIISQQSGIELREIRYQAPRFVETAGQWIPLPPVSGTDSLNALVALRPQQSLIKITRNGKQQDLMASHVFLRDGDVIDVGGHMIPPGTPMQPPQTQPSRGPRPRVTPPPSVR